DRLLRIEKAIDVRRTHAQDLSNVGHGGLLIADLAKQTLGHHENPFAGVGFDMFGNQRHGGAQFDVPIGCLSMIFAQTLRVCREENRLLFFLIMFNYSAAAASTNTGWVWP